MNPDLVEGVSLPEEGGLRATMCCGMRELWGLSKINPKDPELFTPKDFLIASIKKAWGKTEITGHYIFRCTNVIYNQAIRVTETNPNRYGDIFTAFLLENKLGVVTQAPTAINPNSTNELTTYLWTID